MKDAQISVTAFDWVPDFAQGHVRDLRVRWALEEAGYPHTVTLLRQGSQGEPENLRHQPFGQVPSISIDGRSLFESGAIVWRIAESSPALLPAGPAERDRVLCWVFAAINSVEPFIGMLSMLDLFTPDKEAAARIRPGIANLVRMRLQRLQDALGEQDWLVGNFSCADLLMATVLRDLGDTGIVEEFPVLSRYLARCTARPAFKRALQAQLAPFAEHAARYEQAG